MNNVLLDLDLLRTIVTVVDWRSFTVAATRLHSTQSTVSQQVRRLEELVGYTLLDRRNRDIRPTDVGDTFLGYARRMLALHDEMIETLAGAKVMVPVRLGVPEDLVAGRTTHALAAFNRTHPQVKLEVTSGLSRDLMTAYDHGDLDLVLVKQKRHSRESVASWPERLVWVDSAKSPAINLDPIPLVVFPPRGLYRDDMIHALDQLGRPWRISFTSSSLNGIQAAVADGMGISLLPARAITRGHTILPKKGLPVIDTMEIAMFHRAGAEPMVTALAHVLSHLLDGEVSNKYGCKTDN